MSQTLIQSQLDDLESGIQDMIQIMSQTKFYITAQQNMMKRCSQQAAELEVKCLHLEIETESLLTRGQHGEEKSAGANGGHRDWIVETGGGTRPSTKSCLITSHQQPVE